MGDGSREGSVGAFASPRLPGARLGGSARGRALAILLVGTLVAIAGAALVSLDVAALPDPGPNVPITSGPSSSWSPSLAVDASGGLHIAWLDDRSGARGVYYSASPDGGTWSPPARVDLSGVDSFAASLAVEREAVASEGRIYLAYQRGTDIWFTRSDDGIAWAPSRPLDLAPLGVPSRAPAVAASGGRVFVAWSDWRDPDEAHILLRVSLDAGLSWGPEVQLSPRGSSDYEPVLDAKDGVVVAVWRHPSTPGSLGSARSEDGGATWRLSVVSVARSSMDALQDPAVFIDETGIAHVAWSRT